MIPRRRSKPRRKIQRIPARPSAWLGAPETNDVSVIALREGMAADMVLRLLRADFRTADYPRYLKTPHWVRTREEMERHYTQAGLFGDSCRVCGRTAEVWHHVPGLGAYQALFREKPCHLTPLCQRCHRIFEKRGR